MTPPSATHTLSTRQVAHVLELLDIRDLAPKEALLKLGMLAQHGEFSQPQASAIRVLLTLDDVDIARVLRETCEDDEECRKLVRSRVTH